MISQWHGDGTEDGRGVREDESHGEERGGSCTGLGQGQSQTGGGRCSDGSESAGGLGPVEAGEHRSLVPDSRSTVVSGSSEPETVKKQERGQFYEHGAGRVSDNEPWGQ